MPERHDHFDPQLISCIIILLFEGLMVGTHGRTINFIHAVYFCVTVAACIVWWLLFKVIIMTSCSLCFLSSVCLVMLVWFCLLHLHVSYSGNCLMTWTTIFILLPSCSLMNRHDDSHLHYRSSLFLEKDRETEKRPKEDNSRDNHDYYWERRRSKKKRIESKITLPFDTNSRKATQEFLEESSQGICKSLDWMNTAA